MALADLKLGAHDAEQLNTNAILTLFPVAILYYDYLLTISREIRFVWPPVNKLGWVTSVYFLNRYLSILGHAPLLSSYFIRGNLEWAILTDRNSDVESIEVISSIPGCNQYVTTAGGRHPALAWTGMLAYDCAVFALTLYKAFAVGRLGDIPYILDVIVRDGAMYFSALCFVNLANILTLRFAPPLLRNSAGTLTNVLSSVLVSRLLLNLRAENATAIGFSSGEDMQSSLAWEAAFPVAGAPTSTLGITATVLSNDAAQDRMKNDARAGALIELNNIPDIRVTEHGESEAERGIGRAGETSHPTVADCSSSTLDDKDGLTRDDLDVHAVIYEV
ncbi:hypothetical protein BC834DRAFT_973552 [Gloeopeniophorella convolvens]|nr:hypothetical protein BC834DRAFT_973552 [Gloeopeniophorella convolvens]